MSKWKVLLIVAVGLMVAIVLAGYFIIPIKLKPLLENEISKALSAENEGLYKVQISELALTEFWSELNLKDISITPDTIELNQLDSTQIPAMLFQVELNHFSISTDGLITAALDSKKIRFSECDVHSLDLQLWSNPHAGKNEEAKKGKERNIEFTDLEFRQVNADYREWPAIDSSIGSLKSAWFKGGVQLKQMADSMSITLDKQFEIGVNELAMFVPGGLYRIKTDSLLVTNDSSRFAVHGFRMIPLYDKQEFQQHLTEQSDRIDCEVRLVQIDSLDWNALLNGGHFLAHSAFIDDVNLEAYRDRSVPFNESRRPKMPVKLLRELPVDLDLSSIVMHNWNITYQELPEGESIVAVVSFDGLNARCSNITNRPGSIERDSLMVINAATHLFNGPELSATFRYNLNDLNGTYSVLGNLQSFQLPILNNIVEPLTGMQIKDGLHKSSSILLQGTDFKTTGEVVMIYENLEVDTYPNLRGLRKTLTRWTSQSLLYHTDNPKNGKKRIGEVSFNRDPTRFVFNYWWNSYLDGVKSSVLRPGSEK